MLLLVTVMPYSSMLKRALLSCRPVLQPGDANGHLLAQADIHRAHKLRHFQAAACQNAVCLYEAEPVA